MEAGPPLLGEQELTLCRRLSGASGAPLPAAGGWVCGGQPPAGLPAVQASTEVLATVLLSTRLAWRSHPEQLLPEGQSRQPADWPAPARTQGCRAALQPRTAGERGRPGVSHGLVSAGP